MKNKDIFEEKIKLLIKELEKKKSPMIEGLDHSQFCRTVFHRSSLELLENKSIEELLVILETLDSSLKDFKKSNQEFVFDIYDKKVVAEQRKDITVIITSVIDRPFIVDTLFELLKSSNIQLNYFLHPIVKFDDKLISFTYFEIDKIEDKVKNQLKQELSHKFQELVTITDDFSKTIDKTSNIRQRLIELAEQDGNNQEIYSESAKLINWFVEGGFVFLGLTDSYGEKPFSGKDFFSYGLFRSTNPQTKDDLEIIKASSASIYKSEKIFSFNRIPLISPIHRFISLELVNFKFPSRDEKGFVILTFLGMLTSKAMSHETSSIPFIRLTLKEILLSDGLMPNSHDYKEMISIASCLPKTELLQFPKDVTHKDLHLISSCINKPNIKVRYEVDPLMNFISVLVIIPREKFNMDVRKKVLNYLEDVFKSKNASSEYQITTDGYPLVILQVLLPNLTLKAPSVSQDKLQQKIADLVVTWDDLLSSSLKGNRSLVTYYSKAFSDTYKTSISPFEAVEDINIIEQITADVNLEISITEPTDNELNNYFNLNIYRQGEGFTLSGIVPFLENIGFEIISENLTNIKNTQDFLISIHKIKVRFNSQDKIELENIKSSFLPAIKLILLGRAENDKLNQLLINPGLTYLNISILRTLCNYLWQIKSATSLNALVITLTTNPVVASLLVKYFETKFNPEIFKNNLDARKTEISNIKQEFIETLKKVKILADDRNLRKLLNVIDASVRTNFYRLRNETRISLKISCKDIEQMPLPRPLFEIFVNAPDFEGVHLRGGTVARGGIRWSDRNDDYRTEVLGLMKTQMLKNAIIVPVGAKGGFVLKNRPTNPAELPAAVKNCYIRYVRSLLEVADNKVKDKIVPPANCIIYDNNDPYFVVAADRGTATFSDLANAIATDEFNFWLKDAFASGGSNGYDHKKLGITSRGAWETVSRHFREIGIDPMEQEFTVVGIGDMSGDVFGNGLLRSNKAKLLAAFDHRHIFLDPNPEPESSFAERKRIFNLPQSSWKDYNPSLISSGGGIYDRSEKEIKLSSEIRTSLGITQDSLSGQELIRAILMAPVDLLWNGGIGTYIKAAIEDNIQVGDRTNDEVRVNAKDLRVKIVGEGGNLGCTQKGRIEYSKIGGRINTDAIDNSGGVNLSDLEVNLKILLSAPTSRGEITFDERNKLLASIADETCLKVLERNRNQSLAISLGVRASRKRMSYIKALMNNYEKEGIFSREKEDLPDDTTIEHRIELKAGLTRPELAILIGYAKMELSKVILDSDLCDDEFLDAYLDNYFPKSLVSRFTKDVHHHPLRKEIIATEIANKIIDTMGATYLYRTTLETGMSNHEVIKSFISAFFILDADSLIKELNTLDRPSTSRQHLVSMLKLSSSIDGISRWILESRQCHFSIKETVEKYRDKFKLLAKEIENVVPSLEKNRLREDSTKLIINGVNRELSITISALEYSAIFMDVIYVSINYKKDSLEVANLFANLFQVFRIRSLIEMVISYEPKDRWELSALRALLTNLRISISKIAITIIAKEKGLSSESMNNYLDSQGEAIKHYKSIYDEIASQSLNVSLLLVLSNQLFAISRN
ncbi:MAG: NAD-glutamate dehydrogenase [Proteobacteria bacterium]|nr:NAD-glutamate dehydrogenase [Pseudomonadota bacterium]